MKKSLFISLFCIILVYSCILCAVAGVTFHSDSVIAVEAETTIPITQPVTEPVTTVPVLQISKLEPTSISKGDVKVIPISADREKNLVEWTSSDEKILTVDSGGMIYGVKEGKAVVTAFFTDAKVTQEITVKKAEKSQYDGYSTCILDNLDVLKANKKNKSSKNLYFIKVNRQMNCVTVYTYDKNGKYTVPIRAMLCSCGLNNGTIIGDYSLYFKNIWNPLYQNVYGYYTSGIWGDFLFHSVPYYNTYPDELKTKEFNKLGKDASMGCVRMAVADVKWIYDNCPVGTPITIYDDDNAGPLGKPEPIRITDLDCGWDPTDSNPKSPYHKKKPVITGAEDCTIAVGESFDVYKNIKALDTCSNDITDKLDVTGNVVTSRAGEYMVRYSVTDSMHRTTIKDIKVTVVSR